MEIGKVWKYQLEDVEEPSYQPLEHWNNSIYTCHMLSLCFMLTLNTHIGILSFINILHKIWNGLKTLMWICAAGKCCIQKVTHLSCFEVMTSSKLPLHMHERKGGRVPSQRNVAELFSQLNRNHHRFSMSAFARKHGIRLWLEKHWLTHASTRLGTAKTILLRRTLNL